MMSEKEVEAIASEPLVTKRERDFLKDRIKMLEKGQDIFRDVLAGNTRE